MEQRTAEELALRVIRQQRHSFLNHLQVISGWLQLGQPDRAKQYMDEMAARLGTESAMVRDLPPMLSLALVELMLLAEVHGVEVKCDRSGTPPELDAAARALFHAEAEKRISATSESGSGNRVLTVRVGPHGCALHTPEGESEG